MKVVIDTNILVISIPSGSKYRPIFDAYLLNKLSLIVTTAIFFEYIEILQQLSKGGIARYMEDSLMAANNVITPSIYYNWNLLTTDPDDNKFIDAYLADDTDYLVTNDAHFNEAKKLEFPKVNIISADEFLNVLKTL